MKDCVISCRELACHLGESKGQAVIVGGISTKQHAPRLTSQQRQLPHSDGLMLRLNGNNFSGDAGGSCNILRTAEQCLAPAM